MSNVRNVLNVNDVEDLLSIFRCQRDGIEKRIIGAYISALRNSHNSCVCIGDWYYIHLNDPVQFIGSGKQTRHVMFHSRVIDQIIDCHLPL